MTRRLLVGATALVALSALVACGDSDTEDASTQTRTVSTAKGEVEIPADLERVVGVHALTDMPMIDLGIEPVGMGPNSNVNPTFDDVIADIPVTTEGTEADIEKIASLDPDLVLVPGFDGFEQFYDSIKDQLPTVFVDLGTGKDWQAISATVAEIVGRSGENEELEAAYQARLTEIANEYEETLSSATITVVSSWDPGTIQVEQPGSQFAAIVESLGGRLLDLSDVAEPDPTQRSVTLAYEQIELLTDADLVLYSTGYDLQPTAEVGEMLDNQLWKNLPASRAGHVHPVGNVLISHYDQAMQILDNIEAALRAY